MLFTKLKDCIKFIYTDTYVIFIVRYYDISFVYHLIDNKICF